MCKGVNGIYNRFIKRFLDIICAVLAMVVFSWLYVIVALLVRIKLGSPVIYKQQRPGKIDKKTGKEKIFNIYKFRSMSNAKDAKGSLLPDAQRLTRFGRLLRATSLDELPEAWNILNGDMSVIGPRPLVVKYLPYYNEEERRRHIVRPGLSGWAQVNGRTAASWEQRFKFDVEYVENISFFFDMKILVETVRKVIKRSDIVEAGSQGDFDKHRIKQMQEAEIASCVKDTDYRAQGYSIGEVERYK